MSIKSEQLYQLLLKDLGSARFYSNEQSYAASNLAFTLLKKFEEGGEQTRDVALKEFYRVNAEIPKFSYWEIQDEAAKVAIGVGREFLQRLFPLKSWYTPNPSNGSFGPGKSAGIPCTSLYGKYSDGLTYSTDEALCFYKRGHFFCSPLHTPSRRLVCKAKKVAVSTLTTVPKNDTTDRCICIEPSANMFNQQAIKVDLERILVSLGLDVRTQQTRQRGLAREGSMNDRVSTIDLSSASDTIGYEFCRYYLPEDLFSALNSCRTTHVENKGLVTELNMMSTMGNATTFPLQTLIFYSLCIGVYQVLNLKPNTQRSKGLINLGVFGDDIIVDKRAYDLLTVVLHACGFKVNLTKSFKSGMFRESCGGDYLNGYNVRGVYIRSLKGPQALYSAYNRLRRWSVAHKVALPSVLSWLEQQVLKPFYVPFWESDESGFQREDVVGWYTCWSSESRVRVIEQYDAVLAGNLASAGYISWSSLKRIGVPIRGSKFVKVRRFSLSGKQPGKHVSVGLEKFLGFGSCNPPYSEEWAWALIGPNQV